ncbi:uncharacterized protein [Euphorbia lathyris]|uniref:uncharacterized protein n=1 Tax=Euphorbia lathyris TaxID=212925 RepID=UPI0033133AAA
MGRKGKAKIVIENEAESEVEFDESLQAKYDPPFGLIDEREGLLYDRFSKQDLATHVIVDQAYLSSLGLKKDFNEILKFHGWYRLATTQTPVYHNFTIEFLTTWKKELPLGGGKHSFRLNGKPYRLDATTLAALMGVYNHPEEISDFEKPLTKDIAWEQLTGISSFNSQTASPIALLDPLLNLVHKFVAHNLLGKNESNKVSKTELLILWCVANHKPVDNVKAIFEGFSSQTSRKRGSLGLGHLVTNLLESQFKNLDNPEIAIYPTLLNSKFLGKSTFQEVLNRNPTGGASSSGGGRKRARVPQQRRDEEPEEEEPATAGDQREHQAPGTEAQFQAINTMMAKMRDLNLRTFNTVQQMDQRFTNFEQNMDRRLSGLEYVAADYCERYNMPWPYPPADQ